MQVGDKVVMIASSPHFGSGGIKIGDVGILRQIKGISPADPDPIVWVIFPHHKQWSRHTWQGLMHELMLYSDEPNWEI